MHLRALSGALCAVAACAAALPSPASADRRASAGDGFPSPIVIGHRGAAGYLPEHTLPGYALAIKLGADFIEPDLVSTKDGVLIARHEPNITTTTDVARHPEFASRRTTRNVDGAAEQGWFASDFTLAEIRTLRAIQPLAERPQQFNGRYRIPTFAEILRLVRRESERRGRPIGVYPETKHPTYHRQIGLPLEGKLVQTLDRFGLNRRNAPVFIQSFEPSSLKQLHRMTPAKLVQLIDANDVNPDGSLDYTAPYDRPYDWTVSGDPVLTGRTFAYEVTNAGLDDIARYADGIGPWKPYVQSTAGGHTIPPTDLVQRAHARGLLVHPYTFRDEQRRLAVDDGGNPLNEYLRYYALGVDGVFSDFAGTAFAARELFWLQGADAAEEREPADQ